MPRHQTPAQRETVERVMHEFKHGELKTAAGKRKVKNPKQAIAIALHEAGASKYESPAENKRNLRRTKEKERRGETYRDEAEGRSGRGKSARGRNGGGKDQGGPLRGSEKARHPGTLQNEQAAARKSAARVTFGRRAPVGGSVLQVGEAGGVAIGTQRRG